MAKARGRVMVYLDDVLAEWLCEKALEGYKKASLVRRALHVFREAEIGDKNGRK